MDLKGLEGFPDHLGLLERMDLMGLQENKDLQVQSGVLVSQACMGKKDFLVKRERRVMLACQVSLEHKG